MKLDRKRALSLAVVGALLLLAGVATATDIPLKDWPVPGVSSGGLTKFVDIGNPGVFQAMTPCRVADTRGVAFPAATHPFSLAASVSQDWFITGICGVPGNASAVSANFTATNTLGTGFLKVWPLGGSMPTVSTLNYSAGQTVANAAIVPLSTLGGITLIAGVSGTDMIMDVNGYFTNIPNTNNQFYINGYFDAIAAIVGFNYSSVDGSHAVGGYEGGAGIVHGVQGQISSFAAAGSSGVHGIGATTAGKTYAVLGENPATADGAAGVYGLASGATGRTYGVLGVNSSITTGSAAVFGRSGTVSWTTPYSANAGVRGAADGGSASDGVLGEGTSRGVLGARVNSSGVVQTSGVLGYTGTAGVYSFYDYAGIGAKYFIEPHPTDATKQIGYIALEGPEAGTYFRGRGRFQGKSAIIVVPESFRLVTEQDGLTVQITPIGRATSVGVLSMDLTQIVVEGESDVEFSYLVQGVRKGYASMTPVQENIYFVPAGPADRMGPYPERIKERLVSLGIYNPDGTVNLQTAERLGWAQKWREDEQRRQQAQQAISRQPQGSGQAAPQ